jgi:hypothetical protein
MLAVGKAFAKDPANPSPSPDKARIADYRFPWMDEPDCGSCHTGNGNVGKDAANGFFSAGVKQRAFDDTDLSATPRTVDKRDHDATRFAVAPDHVFEYLDQSSTATTADPVKASAPVYRTGKDAHGGVACAACHGAAHSIGPNRDPKSNENVAAIQLQGYAGPILECKVCHTADAFAEYAHLDAGPTSGLPADSGILGGPHNMHPVNDPNWWQRVASETLPGGLHDNFYRGPGLSGEDQCAACHGADHKGTRLSKTPIDLEFTTPKGVKAKWKASEEVGCNKCHSIAKSFRNGPTPPPPGNHDPVITSTPVDTAILGQAYTYAVAANDPDGDPLTYRLSVNPGAMAIDPQGVITGSWAASQFADSQTAPSVSYSIAVTDGQGGQADQPVTVHLACAAGQIWLWDPATKGSCVQTSLGATITSTPPTATVVSGETYSYPVTATDDKGLPLTYSLTDAPAGMSIEASSGLITWATASDTNGKFTFKVTATDAEGGYGYQFVTVHVCPPGTSWMDHHGGMCM